MSTAENKNSSPKKKSLKPSPIRIGTRYRASRVEGTYDAIVIGSGIGGLTTAACMAKQGKKVLVLEQHYTAGGFTHSYARNGYEWDVGVHYIGDMGSPNTLGRKLFDYITDGQLKWAPMDDNYDRFYIGDEQFDLRQGKDGFINSMVSYFPEEETAIRRYVEMLSKVASAMQFFTLNKILPWPVRKLLNLATKPVVPDYINKTTYEVLSGITRNEKLIAVLTGQWGDCGLTPKESSFLIHALIAKHYIHGGYYPIGGASRMAETIIPVIQSAGGDVLTYADVKEILFDGDTAVGVRMADDHCLYAPRIISNAGVLNTFEKLMPESMAKKAGYPKTRPHIQPSMPHLGMYIGVKSTAEELKLPKTNFWIYPSPDHDGNVARFIEDQDNPFPVVYISFPSAKDPSYQSRYPGTSSIEVVAPTTYEQFAQWKDTIWGKRGEDYDQLKDELSERILAQVYEKLPQLKGKIDYFELSTPLSTDYFCRYTRGEIYGLDHTPERFNQDWLRPKTAIKGLYLTGQDILSCGVVGAMIAGLLTTVAVDTRASLPLMKKMFVDKGNPVSPSQLAEA
ncbi:FAD-dependent oxidoreductase [Hahella sp. CCB-MM4]|uniref:phytoene desaturase family protein n=1 Tax=Hahella sp. (strain CCB-MM4) TaxID=1926491 RepID=UPI000B9ABD9C|nr:NAD(P)/FAD-dependent oxidoreductase [Hahella sp. CCB-MM4]OZG74509.1 FAD-dependent oxidoreductase [Hahella sp. CCB-MM4]